MSACPVCGTGWPPDMRFCPNDGTTLDEHAGGSPAGDRIVLKGMRFHTRVGLLPHEEQIPQPLEMDLTVWLSLRHVGESDSPRGLMDYRDLYTVVSETVGTSPHRLLEALCEKVAGRALRLDGVNRVRVAARKPHAPISGPLDYVEVVIERSRDDA